MGSSQDPVDLAARTPQRVMGEKTIRPSSIRSRCGMNIFGSVRNCACSFGVTQ